VVAIVSGYTVRETVYTEWVKILKRSCWEGMFLGQIPLFNFIGFTFKAANPYSKNSICTASK
jgi:hypothetical protein